MRARGRDSVRSLLHPTTGGLRSCARQLSPTPRVPPPQTGGWPWTAMLLGARCPLQFVLAQGQWCREDRQCRAVSVGATSGEGQELMGFGGKRSLKRVGSLEGVEWADVSCPSFPKRGRRPARSPSDNLGAGPRGPCRPHPAHSLASTSTLLGISRGLLEL